MTAPAFLITGWYDFFVDAQIQDFLLLQKTGSGELREKTKILVGPWSHSFFNANHKNYGIRPGWFELIPFKVVREIKDWFDYSLRGISNGWDQKAPIRVYVLGRDRWLDEQEWPPARAVARTYYLHSGGKARTLWEMGP